MDFRTIEIAGNLPAPFLLGCGLTSSLLEQVAALLSSASYYHSCFISYSHKDKQFATRLFHALTDKSVRCWLDEKQLEPGQDIEEGVHRGITLSEKIILCCSVNALGSWWVDSEIEKAFARERELWKRQTQKVSIVMPLDLDGYLFKWQGAKAAEIRRRVAIDFTRLKQDPEKFDRQLELLVSALQIKPRCD